MAAPVMAGRAATWRRSHGVSALRVERDRETTRCPHITAREAACTSALGDGER